MHRHSPKLVVLFLYLILSGSIHAETEWSYTVRPGDNLWIFSQKFLHSPEYWSKVADYNSVQNPKTLPPGLVLKVPAAWLKQPPQAVKALLVIGAVEVQRTELDTRISLKPGMQLLVNDRVIAKQGSALLELANGNRLKILPNTVIEFDVLSAFQESGMVDTRVRLERGRIYSELPKFKNKKSRYEIITPPAITSVRGTSFGVEMHPDSSRMIAEVSEGTVVAGNRKGSQQLDAGFGLAVKEGESPSAPVKRLPSPEIKSVSMPIVSPYHDFIWENIATAEYFIAGLYRKEILNVEGGEQSHAYILIQEKITREPSYHFQNRERAVFKLVISAVDQHGIRGLSSELEFESIPLEQPQLRIEQNGREIRLQWQTQAHAEQYRVKISRRKVFGKETEVVTVDDNVYTFKVSGMKKHVVTVEALVGNNASAASEERELTYTPSYYETIKRLLPFFLLAPFL